MRIGVGAQRGCAPTAINRSPAVPTPGQTSEVFKTSEVFCADSYRPALRWFVV